MAKYEVQLTEIVNYTVVVNTDDHDGLRAVDWAQHRGSLTREAAEIEDTDIVLLDDNDPRQAVSLTEAATHGEFEQTDQVARAARPATGEIRTGNDDFYQPPTWQVRVTVSPTGVIRNAKIYRHGTGAGERHFNNERTTLADVLVWANVHINRDIELTAADLVLA
jgi:hypothetical protein